MISKKNKLYIILSSFFIVNVILAEFIGVKIFSLEDTLNVPRANLLIFGNHFDFNLTAGVLLWPFVFILTDIINEYYGIKGVKFITFLTTLLILYGMIMIQFSIILKPNSWWTSSQTKNQIQDLNQAYNIIFGQSNWIIFASLIAFVIGQLCDAFVFQKIKTKFSSQKLWLRATISTLISQIFDSFIVLFVAFYLSNVMSFNQVISIASGNYIFKFLVAFIMIPILYIIHILIKKYLKDEPINS